MLFNPSVNERDFLYSLCNSALNIDKSIKFAAIMDYEGKLIVGLTNQNTLQRNKIPHTSFFKSILNSAYFVHSNDKNKLNSLINKKRYLSDNSPDEFDFQVLNVDNKFSIAFAPITENQEKYLCIYVESTNSLHETYTKLNTIFEYTEQNN